MLLSFQAFAMQFFLIQGLHTDVCISFNFSKHNFEFMAIRIENTDCDNFDGSKNYLK